MIVWPSDFDGMRITGMDQIEAIARERFGDAGDHPAVQRWAWLALLRVIASNSEQDNAKLDIALGQAVAEYEGSKH